MTGPFLSHNKFSRASQHAAFSSSYHQNTGDRSLPASMSRNRHTPTSTTTYLYSYLTDAPSPGQPTHTSVTAKILSNGTLPCIKPSSIPSSLSAPHSPKRYASDSETSSKPIGTLSQQLASSDLSSGMSFVSIQECHHQSRVVANATVYTNQKSSRNKPRS